MPIGTIDLDLCYRHTKDNCERLARVLQPFHPRLRGAPDKCDGLTLFAGSNFTFVTDIGDVDILAYVTGMGGYDEIARNAVEVRFLGMSVLVMSLEDLVKAKKAAGRAKDKFQLLHIEATLRQRKQSGSSK